MKKSNDFHEKKKNKWKVIEQSMEARKQKKNQRNSELLELFMQSDEKIMKQSRIFLSHFSIKREKFPFNYFFHFLIALFAQCRWVSWRQQKKTRQNAICNQFLLNLFSDVISSISWNIKRDTNKFFEFFWTFPSQTKWIYMRKFESSHEFGNFAIFIRSKLIWNKLKYENWLA